MDPKIFARMNPMWRLSQEYRELLRKVYPSKQLKDPNWTDLNLNTMKIKFQDQFGHSQDKWFNFLRNECDKLKMIIATLHAEQPQPKRQRLLTAMFHPEAMHRR